MLFVPALALVMASTLSFQQLEALVAQAGGTPTQQEYLAGIAAGVESGGNPTAQNPTSTASGLWQELTTTWLGSGGGKYAPTAKQASPLDQAIIAVQQSVGGYQPWAPDLGGYYPGYGAPTAAGTNPQAPAPGSPVANYLKKIGAGTPTSSPSTGAPTATLTNIAPGGSLDPLNWPGDVLNAGGGAVASGLLAVVRAITDPLKHFVEDAGLVVIGLILFAVALALIVHGAGSGGGGGTVRVEEEQTSTTSGGGRPSSTTKTKTVEREREPAPARSSSGRSPEGPVSSSGDARAMEAEAEEAPKAAVAAAAG